MSAPRDQAIVAEKGAPESELVAELEILMPSALTVGRAAAVFCIGSCFHRRQPIADLAIVAAGVRHRPAAFGMPRPDVVESLRETGSASAEGELLAYRSGWWATIPLEARAQPGQVELSAAVRLADGSELISDLGSIEVIQLEPATPLPAGRERSDDDLIAVCMATFEPDMKLFRTQIESLRAQTDRSWVCIISDDCSSPERFEQIEEVVGGDARFVLSRSDKRLGFYDNFERALKMVPPEARLVALSDQDDRWYPEKLQALRGALGNASLAYSDQRLVTADGKVLRNTLWKGRRNNASNLASQVVANTITGAAMLFPRELLQVALPFPVGPGFLFHDHWLGMVAMATGELAFVDRPLYDYVQHAGAVFGDVTHGSRPASVAALRNLVRRARLRLRRGRFERWRAAYFYGYLSREVQAQTLLVRCSATLTARNRRALRRFVGSARSPSAFAWLALRPLRLALRRNETLGSEIDLVRGIAWRWLIELRMRRAKASGPLPRYDARLPDPATFEQAGLRRWRARI